MPAEIVALFVGPLTECVKYFGKPILRPFNYLCCFSSNKKDLIEKALKLEEQREQVEGQIIRARNNVEEILCEATSWLGKVGEIQGSKNDIDDQIKDVKTGCLAVKSRFQLSRRVKKTAEAMERLLEERPRDGHVSRPPLPPSVAVPHIQETPTPEFESRAQVEGNIKAILKDENVKVMGICGMGGVGKTTLAEKIKDRVKTDHVFGESVMAVVSQQPDKLGIQAELAEHLGLDLKDITALSSRAHKLRARLTEGEKRTLVILDDVWERLELKELGITSKSGSQGCTILLISRNRDVLKSMDAEPIHEIGTLSEIEARSLFQQKVGAYDDQNLLSIAQNVVRECKGLPLALVTVALALKGHNDSSAWPVALQQLRSANPDNMPTVLKEVYTPLKLSYNVLIPDEQSVFLLCCLFREDGNIPVDSLTAYAMGLRMFKGISSLGDVRDRINTLVDTLKSRFLLLEGKDKHHVRMHDVVRDVAIFIASSDEKQLIRCGDKCTWISAFLEERIELSEVAVFPRLRLLMTHGGEMHICDNFFQGVRNLNVLSITNIHSVGSSLPHTTILLKGLRTLILSHMDLETISVVAELENLKIFICRFCTKIKKLPVEMRSLVRLKLLEFSDCRSLRTVAPGIISSLLELEELKMVNSFNGWEAEENEGKKRENAALIELQSLSRLTCLAIEMSPRLAAEQFNLPPNIVKYDISICPYGRGISDLRFEKNMRLHLTEEKITSLVYWFAKCVNSVECMLLEGEGSNIVDLQQAHRCMRWLELQNSSTVKELVNIQSSMGSIFPELEYLQLKKLVNLKEIHHGRTPEGSFDKLETLCLIDLPALEHFWRSSPYPNPIYLPKLYKLEIDSCKMMEQVFLWTDENAIREGNQQMTAIFPDLMSFKLSNLQSLTTFCKGVESIGFPRLDQMVIEDCPQLKSLVSNVSAMGNNNPNNSEDDAHLFPKQVPSGTFCRLDRLDVSGCGKIRSLFSSSTAQNLCNLRDLTIFSCEEMVKVIVDDNGETTGLFPQLQCLQIFGLPKLQSFCKWGSCDRSRLKVIRIRDCGEMVKVFEDDGERENYSGNGKTCHLFPQLEELEIFELPKLKEFCKWESCDQIELPLLRKVFIFDCPKLERLSSGSLTAPNLEALKVNFADIAMSRDQDLNAEVQQQFFKAKEEESFYKWVLKIKGMERMSDLLSDHRKGYRLKLEIEDSILAAEHIEFPSDMATYDITIGHSWIESSFERNMSLDLPINLILGNWIHQCVRSVEYMRLEGEGSNNLNFEDAQKMRELTLSNSSTVKKLVNMTSSIGSTAAVFPQLERLHLELLPNLEEICHIDGPMTDGSSANAFHNLRELTLSELPALKQLWKSRRPHQSDVTFLQLERLHIVSCEMMEQVFLWNDRDDYGSENHRITIIFPNLTDLALSNLPRLKALCNGIQSIKLPLLAFLKINKCPQLKSLVPIIRSTANNNESNSEGIDHGFDHDGCLQFFCKTEKIAFGGLKYVYIGGDEDISSRSSTSSILWCDKTPIRDLFAGLKTLCIHDFNTIRSLFSSSMAANLINLQDLTIMNCGEMVTVIEDDGEEKPCAAIELPLLQSVKISNCPQIKRFSLGSVTAPNLMFAGDQFVHVNYNQDINVMLRHLFSGVEERDPKEEEEEDDEEAEEREETEDKENKC